MVDILHVNSLYFAAVHQLSLSGADSAYLHAGGQHTPPQATHVAQLVQTLAQRAVHCRGVSASRQLIQTYADAAVTLRNAPATSHRCVYAWKYGRPGGRNGEDAHWLPQSSPEL